MTTLPPNKQFGRRTTRKVDHFVGVTEMIAALTASALIAGCAARHAIPSETVFSSPVEIVLPTTELQAAIDATAMAESAGIEAVNAVNAITPANVSQAQPEAMRWSQNTLNAIRSISDPLHKAKSINEVAADRIIEATLQTTDARARLKESELMRATERVAYKKSLDAKQKENDDLRAVEGKRIGYSIAGLGVLCLALGAIGIIGQKFVKIAFGAGFVGLVLIGIGLGVVNQTVWISRIGVGMFAALIIGGTIYFVRRAKHDDKQKLALYEAGKAIARSVETAVDVVDDFDLTDKALKVMKGVQSSTPLAERIVDDAQAEMGKVKASK